MGRSTCVAVLLALLLFTACRFPTIDPHPPTPAAAQAFVEQELRTFWQGRYAAYLAGEESSLRFLQPLEIAPRVDLPGPVAQAYAFYVAAVERADWGNVYLLQPTVQGRPFYLIYVTTDGDDGWLELYRGDGSFLGAARRYLELVAWGDVATLRAQTGTGAYPTALRTRFAETLWGK